RGGGGFAGAFLWELLTANLDVAYRVLHPSLPIEPDVIELPLRIETDAAITTLANSISLTPGTLTMEHDPETNTLFVHGIVGRRRDAVVTPIRRWEDLLLVIYDEEGSPSDPPPERYHQRVPDGGTAPPDGEGPNGGATGRSTDARDRSGGDGDER
ncbi:MAG: Na+/H+ antiporter subunit E, partial [Halobacteriales archaeon]